MRTLCLGTQNSSVLFLLPYPMTKLGLMSWLLLLAGVILQHNVGIKKAVLMHLNPGVISGKLAASWAVFKTVGKSSRSHHQFSEPLTPSLSSEQLF